MAIVAAVLRIPVVGAGLPFVWYADEPTTVRVGAIMVDHNSLNPHFFAYPSVLFDVIAATGWIQKFGGLGWQPGAGLRVENEGIAHTTDPHLFIALRLVTVVLSIGICVVVWGISMLITRRWWAATLAGLPLAISPIMVSNGVLTQLTPIPLSSRLSVCSLQFG